MGDLKEESYVECPQGMSNVGKDDCMILNKCIYGIVQAARQYYKEAIKILKNSQFIRGNVNLCKGVVYRALYIDYNLMVGEMAAIDDAIAALKSSGLVLKVMEGLQDYLSCEIKYPNDKKRAWLGQPHLIENLENKFGNCMQVVQSQKTPGTPNFLIMRPIIDSEKISIKNQWEYWLGNAVGAG